MISAVSWVHLGICFGLLKVVSPSLGIDPYGVEPEVGMVSFRRAASLAQLMMAHPGAVLQSDRRDRLHFTVRYADSFASMIIGVPSAAGLSFVSGPSDTGRAFGWSHSSDALQHVHVSVAERICSRNCHLQLQLLCGRLQTRYQDDFDAHDIERSLFRRSTLLACARKVHLRAR